MMKHSAGILPYKYIDSELYVYLEHPGGPFWKDKDKWSIVKGEYINEKALNAALREFKEESGFDLEGNLEYMGSFKLKHKLLVMFMVEEDLDVTKMKSNTFKRMFNGTLCEFPEMDEARWFKIDDAYNYIFDRQRKVLDRIRLLKGGK